MSRIVELIDRSDFRQKMNQILKVNNKKTAVLTIDAHRGHLDPTVATMPCDPVSAAKVTESIIKVCELARSKDIPVIHILVKRRRIPGIGTEASTNPFAQAVTAVNETTTPGRKSDLINHNLEGSPQMQLMPGVFQEGDYMVDTKKRKSVFYGTDLEILLRVLGVDTIILVGVNTNTCVQNAAFDMHNMDMIPIVVEEGVDSMYGKDLHVFGLENIIRCLGWVLNIDELKEKLNN